MTTTDDNSKVRVQFPEMEEPMELDLSSLALFYLKTHADRIEGEDGETMYCNPRPVLALTRQPELR
jgi:hypothetical protein